MIKFISEDYNRMSRLAADIVAGQISGKPHSVLALPSGATPVGMYMALVDKKLNYSSAVAFNLGEYFPIGKRNKQSCGWFLFDSFFNKINIRPENIHLLDGKTTDPDAVCRDYEQMIAHAGGIDLAILGIGSNGHIAFNEPAERLYQRTHQNDLTARTIEENSRFFSGNDEVPSQCLTMGMGTIFSAKRILVLANGESKADAVSRIFSGGITTSCPATLLNLHSDVTIIMDREAAAKI